jgi:hypothetical protein
VGSFPNNCKKNARVRRTMSFQKKTTEAAKVPHWMTAVKAAPGSSQPSSSGMTRRWAVLLMGRNSVSPWMIPRTTA